MWVCPCLFASDAYGDHFIPEIRHVYEFGGKPACTPCVRGSKVDGLWSQHFSTFLSFSPFFFFFFFTCPFLSLFARLAFMVVARPVVMRSRGMKLGEALNKKKRKKKKKKGSYRSVPGGQLARPHHHPSLVSAVMHSHRQSCHSFITLLHFCWLVGWLLDFNVASTARGHLRTTADL